MSSKIHVTHECFIFLIEQSQHGALYIWSSNRCQMSISWHKNQSLSVRLCQTNLDAKFVLVSGVTRESNPMIGANMISIIAMTIYVILATSKYDNINIFYFVVLYLM